MPDADMAEIDYGMPDADMAEINYGMPDADMAEINYDMPDADMAKIDYDMPDADVAEINGWKSSSPSGKITSGPSNGLAASYITHPDLYMHRQCLSDMSKLPWKLTAKWEWNPTNLGGCGIQIQISGRCHVWVQLNDASDITSDIIDTGASHS